jgi:serine/threonine protein kinase
MSNLRPHLQSPHETDPFLGLVVGGRFRILEKLAVTAMSQVYRGVDERSGRLVAIKVLVARDQRPETWHKYRARFFREADALSRLRHPHVVKVFDHGLIHNDIPYLVMEYLEGASLCTLLKHETPRPHAILALAEQVTRALEAAHAEGIVHRDLKPSNLLVSGPLIGDTVPHVHLIDFGIAKDLDDTTDLTGMHTVVGTPMYMAPEQTMGDPVDGRTDIYALGCLLFRLFVGRSPFADKSGTGLLVAHLSAPVPSFADLAPDHGLPSIVEWTVRRCLEKRPDDRFADMVELRRALHLCLRSLDDPRFRPRLALTDGRVHAAPPRTVAPLPEPFPDETLDIPTGPMRAPRLHPRKRSPMLRSLAAGVGLGAAMLALAWALT